MSERSERTNEQSSPLSGLAAEGGGPMSTRRLILAALLCGLAILVAFTVQLLQAR